MKHHKDWRTRHMNNMREMKAAPSTFSAAGTKGNQIPGLDTVGLTKLSGSKEEGVKITGKKRLGGPM